MTVNHLQLINIRLSLQTTKLLQLDADLKGGEILTVMGPSGSGKSTLLAYIAGFLPSAFHASGSILLNGKEMTQVAAENRCIGLLFQDPLLFPHMSVGENLGFALPAGSKGKIDFINRRLTDMNLEGFFKRDPATLSGGQKARVALLRLLLSAPKAVLLDEPFSKLDTQLRQEIRGQVFDSLRDAQLPTLLVTHDREDAEATGGQVIEL